MRNCIRCNTPMVEGLEARTGDACGFRVGNNGIFATLAKVECAVCPKCGHVEMYVSDDQKLQKLTKQ